jgi:hypothetical protein
MGGLDDPSSCAPVGVVDLGLDLFAAGADVGREVVVGDQMADFAVVVGAV